MTERNPPVWMQSGTYNAVDDRMVTGLLVDRDTGPSGTASAVSGGVVPGFGQLAVTVPGTTMQVTVAEGAVIIPSQGTTPAGAYICYNAGPATFTIDIAATGNPRKDVIYAEVEDQTTGGDESVWRFGVAKGAPSASPVDPALLAGQFPIASVRVIPAAQNGGVNKVMATQLTDLRVFAASMGGVHITKNGIPNPSHQPGRLLYNVDSGYLYISDGTVWNYFLTYQAWMSIFSSLRPRQVYAESDGTIPVGAGATVNKAWDPTPTTTDTGVGGSIPAVVLTDMQSPSGIFKVSISGFGRVSVANAHAHMSFSVLDGTTQVLAPSATQRAISFYMTAWEHHGATFLVSGLPVNKKLTFRLEFYKDGATAAAVFHYTTLMVEPVL